MSQLVFALLLSIPLFVTAALLLWSRARRARIRLQDTSSVVRTVTLDTSTKQEGRGLHIAMVLALVPLFATCLLLASRWDRIPVRFPTHWGASGVPNDWSTRSPLSVFGPLVTGALLIALFLLMDVLTDRYSPGFTGRPATLRVKRNALAGAAWFIALLFCAVGALPLAQNPTLWIPLFIVGCLVGSLLLVAMVVYQYLQIPQAVLTASQRTTDSRFWKAGLIYFNPSDCALMVPKRDGLGYTLNFGRPVAWVILAGILIIPLILPIVLHTRHHP